MKIIIAGLINDDNVGDRIIAECTKFLVRSIDKNIQIDCIDFSNIITSKFLLKIISYLGYHNFVNTSFVLSKLLFNKRYSEAIKQSSCVIFSCGSFKFGTQLLWLYYSLIINKANKFDVPVMFSAMNVQKYDSCNKKCNLLRKFINFPCVKMFTSRDGLGSLSRLQEYTTNNIIKYPVGDPAYWINEIKINKPFSKNSDFVVGINLIKGDNFIKYGGSLSENYLVNIYSSFIAYLDNKHIKWQMFTNGLTSDYNFGIKVLNASGNSSKKILIPKDINDYVSILLSFNVVLAARLHAIICSYSFHIPVFGFAWDKKISDFSKIAKIENLILSEQDLNLENLICTFNRAKDFKYDIENLIYWRNETLNKLKMFLNLL